MTRLHHVPWGRSFRVLWLLQEMGITPDEIIRYRIGAPEMRGAGLMGASPAGRIPALEIDGITIFESAAILQYLCETRPQHGFGRAPGHGERVRYLEALGFGVTVFLGVKLGLKGRVSLDDFERAVAAIPEVQTVEHVLGLYDYRLRVVARDLPDFERVLRRRIMTLPGVGGVEANVLLSEERRPGPLG